MRARFNFGSSVIEMQLPTEAMKLVVAGMDIPEVSVAALCCKVLRCVLYNDLELWRSLLTLYVSKSVHSCDWRDWPLRPRECLTQIMQRAVLNVFGGSSVDGYYCIDGKHCGRPHFKIMCIIESACSTTTEGSLAEQEDNEIDDNYIIRLNWSNEDSDDTAGWAFIIRRMAWAYIHAIRCASCNPLTVGLPISLAQLYL